MEPDQRVLVPPARGGGRSGAGGRLHAGERDHGARRGEGDGARLATTTSLVWSGASRSSATPGSGYIEEMCKMRAFDALWERIVKERYGIDDTEVPHGSGTACRSIRWDSPRCSPRTTSTGSCSRCWPSRRSKDARARAVQLPAWNEALGLPRAWDQQWSLRAQQILAYETDLLEYGDIFEGSKVIEELTDQIATEAWEELERVLEQGGSVDALGYMKEQTGCRACRAPAGDRGRRADRGRAQRYTRRSPRRLSKDSTSLRSRGSTRRPRPTRSRASSAGARNTMKLRPVAALDELKRVAETPRQPRSPLRSRRRRPASPPGSGPTRCATSSASTGPPPGSRRRFASTDPSPIAECGQGQGGGRADRRVAKLRMLVAKPGLDGHSNAAEQVALRARDAGFEVVYQGIRLTPATDRTRPREEDVHTIGPLDPVRRTQPAGARGARPPQGGGDRTDEVPVIVGGVIPEEDEQKLMELGVARVYTPKDFDLTKMIGEIADLIGA